MNSEEDNYEMAPEYDFSDAVQGMMYKKHRLRALRQLLDADLAATFKDPETLNAVLRESLKQNAAGVAAKNGWHVVLEKDAETTAYSVWCQELPGCISAGSSEDEAMANIREAISLYLETSPLDSKPGQIVRMVTL